MNRYSWKVQWVLVLLLIAAFGAAVVIGSAQRSSVDCIARAVGTNVNRVSVRVISSTDTFYYPSRLRYDWEWTCKHLGFPIASNCFALTSTATPISDVLWVTITYCKDMSIIGPLVGEEVDAGGRTNLLDAVYALVGQKTTVSKWPLVAGAGRYRGKAIRIRTKPFSFRTTSHGEELAIIEFR